MNCLIVVNSFKKDSSELGSDISTFLKELNVDSSLFVYNGSCTQNGEINVSFKGYDFVITLEIEGKKISSEGLAQKLSNIMLNGSSTIDFIIGGSLGLSDTVKKRGDFLLSFSEWRYLQP